MGIRGKIMVPRLLLLLVISAVASASEDTFKDVDAIVPETPFSLDRQKLLEPNLPLIEIKVSGCQDQRLQNGQPWHDSGAPLYTCSWYAADAEKRCARYGFAYRNEGITPDEACCVCSLLTPPPTKKPTKKPTPKPTGPPCQVRIDGTMMGYPEAD